MVAIVRRYEPSVVEQRSTVVPVQAAQTSIGALADGLQAVGDAAWNAEDEIATAHAYQVDADFTDFMRITMDGDGEGAAGYLASRGMEAVAGRETVLEQVQSRYRQMVESLNPRVRPATVRSLETRYQAFLGQVNRHADAQRRAAVAAAGVRRDEASRNAAIRAGILGDMDGFNTALAAIEGTAADMYPNDPAAQAAYVQEHASDAYRAVAQGIAEESGDSAAWDFVEANQGRFETGDLWTMAEAYRGGALDERGMQAADAAVDAVIAQADVQMRETYSGGADAPGDGAQPTASRFVDPGMTTGQPLVVDTPWQGTVRQYADRNPDALDPRGFDQQSPSVAAGRGIPSLPSGGQPVEAYMPPPRDFDSLVTEYADANPDALDPRGPEQISPEQAEGLGIYRLPDRPRPTAPIPEPTRLPGDRATVPPVFVPPDFTAARNQIMQIENPRARQAAMDRLNDRIEAYEAQMREVHDQALTQAQEIIIADRGMNGVDPVPAHLMMHLTPTERENLHAFARTVRSNRDPQTPDDVAYLLHYYDAAGDVEMLERTILENRHQISASERQSFLARAAALRAGETNPIDDIEWASINTEVTRAMQNFGLTASNNPTSRRLLDVEIGRWARSYTAREGQPPRRDEVAARANELLAVQVSVDGRRMGGAYEGSAFGVDIGDMTDTRRDDITLDRLETAARRGQLQINNISISEDDLVSVMAAMAETFGREPTVDELWTGLVISTTGGY